MVLLVLLLFLALEKIVKSQYLLGDLKHLTNFNHTGTLEVYHSVYNKYCPKQQFSRITQSWFVKKVTYKKERIYVENLMEETIAIKTSNMAYPVPCLKNVIKNTAPTEKPDKNEVINNTKTRFRL